jgi:hypothetical protein
VCSGRQRLHSNPQLARVRSSRAFDGSGVPVSKIIRSASAVRVPAQCSSNLRETKCSQAEDLITGN